jgi:probable phosphoglycerate mutase
VLTVVLTRHGLTDRSVPEQYLGQHIEASLTEEGRAAARALGERLRGVAFGRVVSSPLARAVETAHLVAPALEVTTDPRLAEVDYGDWEGLTIPEIEARFTEARRSWEADPAGFAIPGGESGEDVARRVRSFLEEHIEQPGADDEEQLLLLVAHSTLNRVLLSISLGVPLRDYRRRFRQDWANLTVLRFKGAFSAGAQLLVANDLGHIRGISGVTWG